MKTFKFIHVPRGFSMIEVLISVVILGFGLLALAALQTTIIRSSSETKAQTIALQLAKDKLEDLRSYRDLAGYRALTSSPSNEALNDVAGDLSGVNFTRSWVVTRWAYKPSTATFVSVTPLTGTTPTGGSPAIYTSNNEYKRVAVVVSWADANGATQSIGIEDAVGAISPGDGSKIVLNNTSTSVPRYPRVIIYDPSNTAGVIPIAVGNGTDTAATNPKPEIAGNNNNQRVVETRFDVLTYAGLSGGTAQAQSRVETAVIGCTCNKDNKVTTDITYRPTYWNGFRYSVPSVASYTPISGAATGVTQSQYCDTCCRDHHDESIATGKPKFDPRRTTHTHYKIVNGALVVAGATDDYLESCRLIRVDGVFRVAADMYNDYFNLIATKNDGTSTAYAPTTTATTNYKNIVLDYLDARVVNQDNSLLYNTLLTNATVLALEFTRSINLPSSITIQRTDDTKWLHSRGLFIDYLEQEAIDKITNAKDNCVSPSTLSSCVLKYTPFTSINITELTTWSPLVGDANLNVSMTDFVSSTAGEPIRGKVQPGSSPTTIVGDIKKAYASIFPSNSGLIGSLIYPSPIDVDEDTDLTNNSPSITLTPLQDSQDFVFSGTSSTTSGDFYVQLLGALSSTYTYTAKESVSPLSYSSSGCTYFAKTNGSNSTPERYGCSVSNIGDVSVPRIVPNSVVLAKYNYEVGSTSKAAVSGCTSTGVSGSITYTPSGNDSYTINTCKKFSVYSDSTGLVPGVVLGSGVGETTTFSLANIEKNSTLSFYLKALTDTRAALTCTYTIKTTCNSQGNNCSNSNIFTVSSAACP